MAIPITNLAPLPPPTPLVANTAAPGAQGASFQQALANAANQQFILNGLALPAGNALDENGLAPPLFLQLEDTGNLESTFLQDFPGLLAANTQNPNTNASTALPANAITAALTTPGLLLPVLIEELFPAQTATGTTAIAQPTTPANALTTAATGVAGAQSPIQTLTLTGTAAEQVRLQVGAIRLPAVPAGRTQEEAAAPANPAPVLAAVPQAIPATVATQSTITATATTPVATPTLPTASTNNTVANAITTAQGQTIPAQVPIVTGLNERQQLPGEQITPFPEPVSAAVAAAPLPSSEVGDRPAMAGNRLAAVAEGVALQQSAQATSAASFQSALKQASLREFPPGGNAPEARASTSPAPVPASNTIQGSIGVAPGSTPANSPTPTYSSTGAVDSPAAEGASSRAVVVATPSPVQTLAEAPARMSTSATNPPGAAAPAAINTLPGNLGLINPAGYVAFSASAATTAAAGTAPSAALAESAAKAGNSANANDFNEYNLNSSGNFTLATAATSAPASTQATPTFAAQVADGIVTHAQANTQQNGSTEFRLRLDPPELGAVNVQLVSVGDEVRGHVVVASDSVRQMIESQLPELRQRLEAAGVTIQNFEVSTDSSGKGNRNPWQEPTSRTPTPGQEATSAAAASRFRRAMSTSNGQIDVMA